MSFSRRQEVLRSLKPHFPDFPVFFGFDYIPELRSCIELKTPFIFCDHAYWDRGYSNANFRIVLSDIHQTGLVSRPLTRLPKLHPWKRGKHVLVFPPSDTIAKTFGAQSWAAETVETLKRHTDRPVIVKRKQDGDLDSFLQDCHAVVGYATVASTDAVIRGIPAFCGPHCPATPIGLQDLSQIENPIYPDRAEWLRSLGSSQFNVSEFGSVREFLLGAR